MAYKFYNANNSAELANVLLELFLEANWPLVEEKIRAALLKEDKPLKLSPEILA